ncbi:MAG: V-type ATP synthase subunit E [Thermovirgaceae bacterium]|nr:V-type ATP synthase subunit E [Thermovirgaceae bacterium]
MSLEDIKVKIEADAKAEAREIIGRFEEQAGEILKTANAEIEELNRRLDKKIKSEETEIHRRRKIVANLDVRKIDLGARRELITRAFSEGLDLLSGTPRDKYVPFMSALLKRSVVSGDEIVYVGAEEKYLDQKWIDDFNNKEKTKLNLSGERIPASGGFTARRGDIYVNCTWEVLLRWVREDMEAEVVNRLFSN